MDNTEQKKSKGPGKLLAVPLVLIVGAVLYGGFYLGMKTEISGVFEAKGEPLGNWTMTADDCDTGEH